MYTGRAHAHLLIAGLSQALQYFDRGTGTTASQCDSGASINTISRFLPFCLLTDNFRQSLLSLLRDDRQGLAELGVRHGGGPRIGLTLPFSDAGSYSSNSSCAHPELRSGQPKQLTDTT